MICHLGLIGYFQGAMGPALAPPPPPLTYLGLLARSQVIFGHIVAKVVTPYLDTLN